MIKLDTITERQLARALQGKGLELMGGDWVVVKRQTVWKAAMVSQRWFALPECKIDTAKAFYSPQDAIMYAVKQCYKTVYMVYG